MILKNHSNRTPVTIIYSFVFSVYKGRRCTCIRVDGTLSKKCKQRGYWIRLRKNYLYAWTIVYCKLSSHYKHISSDTYTPNIYKILVHAFILFAVWVFSDSSQRRNNALSSRTHSPLNGFTTHFCVFTPFQRVV